MLVTSNELRELAAYLLDTHTNEVAEKIKAAADEIDYCRREWQACQDIKNDLAEENARFRKALEKCAEGHVFYRAIARDALQGGE